MEYLLKLDWQTLVATVLVPILVALLSVYFGYMRGKKDAYRNSLYGKQIEAFADIHDAMGDILSDLVVFVNEHQTKSATVSDGEMQKFCADMRDKHVRLRRRYYKWAAFLPSDTCGKVIGFLLEDYSPPEPTIEALRDLSKKYADVYTDMMNNSRQLLGIGPLSQETLKLVGSVSKR